MKKVNDIVAIPDDNEEGFRLVDGPKVCVLDDTKKVIRKMDVVRTRVGQAISHIQFD